MSRTTRLWLINWEIGGFDPTAVNIGKMFLYFIILFYFLYSREYQKTKAKD